MQPFLTVLIASTFLVWGPGMLVVNLYHMLHPAPPKEIVECQRCQKMALDYVGEPCRQCGHTLIPCLVTLPIVMRKGASNA